MIENRTVGRFSAQNSEGLYVPRQSLGSLGNLAVFISNAVREGDLHEIEICPGYTDVVVPDSQGSGRFVRLQANSDVTSVHVLQGQRGVVESDLVVPDAVMFVSIFADLNPDAAIGDRQESIVWRLLDIIAGVDLFDPGAWPGVV